VSIHAEVIGRQTRLERGDGIAEIGFARRGNRTALAHLYQHDPCRVLFPRPAHGDPLTAVLLMTSGGFAGGDHVRVQVRVGADAAALVTTQAAEKFYRSLGPAARFEVDAQVEPGAWLEWLPQEAILFEGARARRSAAFGVRGSGQLLASDTIVFGRLARGENFRQGSLFDRWQVRRDGRLVWADVLKLDGDLPAIFADPAALAGAEALGTVVYVGGNAQGLLSCAREATAGAPCRTGSTLINGLLLTRFMGGAVAVRNAVVHFLGIMRHAAAGLPQAVPKVCYN
jgi:urease accessory protein